MSQRAARSTLLKHSKKHFAPVMGRRTSRGVEVRHGDGHGRIEKESRLGSQFRQREEKNAKLRQGHIVSLSFKERQEFLEQARRDDKEDGDWMDVDADEAAAFATLPPGEEGFFQSHAGGEEELCRNLFTRKGKDIRTRRDRRLRQTRDWNMQMPYLVDAYMAFNAGAAPRSTGDNDRAVTWSVLTIDMFGRESQLFASTPDEPANSVLIRHGYIGVAPLPTVAISIKVLEYFHHLRLVCPRLSMQAQVSALCRLHRVALHPYLTKQFSTAYDVFLEIRRHVDTRVAIALHRNADNWRMRNACAPCLYTLEGEPDLHPAMLVTMDGNQSLKLIDDMFRYGPGYEDTRDARSDIWLRSEEVDKMKDEVQNARKRLSPTKDGSSPLSTSTANVAAADASDTSSGPSAAEASPPASHTVPSHSRSPQSPAQSQVADNIPDGDDLALLELSEIDDNVKESLDECVKRWRNAGPEARKKMFALFAVTGIFISICRHGHLLAICDMIRSGELMKYPLAIINKMADVFGLDFRYGYDIACAFDKILRRSSLGSKVTRLGISGVVPAFHGHAHNRSCQLSWHPSYMPGCGKEDFEGCERVFSASNALATTTRFASIFHRHQAVEEFFKHWDEEKYAEEATFLLNNYRQALKIIDDDGIALEALCARILMTSEDFERYYVEERKYLNSLTRESEDVLRVVEYMDVLLKLEEAQAGAADARSEFLKLDYYIVRDGIGTKEIAAIKRRHTTTSERYLELCEHVRAVEDAQGIAARWTKGSAQYDNGLIVLAERKYRQAVDNLERLLVQRYFELSKLGMSGTGYRQREKITKALKARATAIKRALEEYNRRAILLPTARPQLSWTEVTEMVSVADFDILRDTRQDLKALEWTEPLRRRAMGFYFNIKRAKEEIHRLNVEIPRLLTHMFDDHVDYYRAVQAALFSDPHLAHELSLQWEYRNAVHMAMAHELHEFTKLSGFSGALCTGQRVGRNPILSVGVPLPPWAIASNAAVGTPDEEDPEVQEGLIAGLTDEEAANQFVDYIVGLE